MNVLVLTLFLYVILCFILVNLCSFRTLHFEWICEKVIKPVCMDGFKVFSIVK